MLLCLLSSLSGLKRLWFCGDGIEINRVHLSFDTNSNCSFSSPLLFRHFNLRLKRDTTLFSPDLVVEVSGVETPVDTSHIYSGEIFGESHTTCNQVLLRKWHWNISVVLIVKSKCQCIPSKITHDYLSSSSSFRSRWLPFLYIFLLLVSSRVQGNTREKQVFYSVLISVWNKQKGNWETNTL